MAVAVDEERIAQLVERRRHEPAALLAVLQDIQEDLHWLPEDALRVVAKMLDVPLTQVYRVATFYKALSLEPQGRHIIRVCVGTACHLRGAPSVLDTLSRLLRIGPGETTDDFQFSIETAHCLGACALAPVVSIDGKYHGQMDPVKVREVIERLRDGAARE
ncbi:MAG: NAD(P)H-dependent oxidoreductase subunit E [Armatimonadetes bacterium]|nr:NAD(P)H-dependent oxidoreductase subunit E [Armatimonadota bacterium]